MTLLLWILALALIAVGVLGTVLPALPGPVLVFAGIFLGAWADHFEHVGPAVLILLGLLTAATYLVDLSATALGVRRSGASKRAVVGTVIGMLAGLPFGLPGLLIGPFAGALVAELTVRNDLRQASRAGVGAWLGFLIGSIVKLALVFTMLGIFLAALFLF
jgi:uncharacterized protein